MTREEFNNRIKLSPLWDYLYDKKLENGVYSELYRLTELSNIVGFDFNSYIIVNSAYDRDWSHKQRITKVEYGNTYKIKRNQYHHQLLDQEKIEMVETLKLVFTAMSDDKANDIINTLYAQYMDKVNNKDFLSDDETIHTYLKYEGKIIAFWGKINCEFDMFDGMTID